MVEEHYKTADLSEPFYFNRPTDVTDGAGGFTTTNARNPATGFHFAKVRPLRGQERMVADGLASVEGLRFVVYAALGIRTTDTLVYTDLTGTTRQYNIRVVHPPVLSVFQEIEAEAGEVL